MVADRKQNPKIRHAITAGLSRKNLRSIFRGEETTEQPNLRYSAHSQSLLLHLRPRTFVADAISFNHTFYLGFLAAFLLAVEVITGFILMVYYVPTPEGAYASILRITDQVPFGALLRDLHRLAGEVMIAVVAMHMLRTFLTDSHKGKRWMTWMTGVFLLILTLGLGFSGYLLPWDQLAYWAVTIGTSMLEAVPIIGHPLNLLARGGAEIGGDGLLRFYMLHVFILPLGTALLLAAHYYRVARLHGVSRPVLAKPNMKTNNPANHYPKSIAFIPDVITSELLRGCLCLLLLIIIALFFYDAPLERHADPGKTPLNTEAPWFFLWLQGLLKLGNKTWMGVVFPGLLVMGLLLLPLVDHSDRKPLKKRPLALVGTLLGVAIMVILSFMGTHRYGIHLPPAQKIFQSLAPDEGHGFIDELPFNTLKVGIYTTREAKTEEMPMELGNLFNRFKKSLSEAAEKDALPEAEGIMIVEDWQADLKRITLRMSWKNPSDQNVKSNELIRHIHRMDTTSSIADGGN